MPEDEPYRALDIISQTATQRLAAVRRRFVDAPEISDLSVIPSVAPGLPSVMRSIDDL